MRCSLSASWPAHDDLCIACRVMAHRTICRRASRARRMCRFGVRGSTSNQVGVLEIPWAVGFLRVRRHMEPPRRVDLLLSVGRVGCDASGSRLQPTGERHADIERLDLRGICRVPLVQSKGQGSAGFQAPSVCPSRGGWGGEVLEETGSAGWSSPRERGGSRGRCPEYGYGSFSQIHPSCKRVSRAWDETWRPN